MTNEQLWQTILGELEVSVSRANFTTWFKNTAIESRAKNQIVVAVPNAFTKEWLENKYRRLIMRSLQNFYPNIRSINYIIKTLNPALAKEEIKTSPETIPHQSMISSELNPRYTFDAFVVGYSNEIAFTAAEAISKNIVNNKYNPLFIYGDVGLGKTHLMQAIGNQALANKELKVKYATSEKFTNDFVEALRNRNVMEFKNKYRDNDLLLMDDIQFIAPKEQTQGEFFHTFNSLYQGNRQVVLTSDRPPRDIQALEDRLCSRFEGGMLVDIAKPDIETRLAILQEKQKSEKIELPDNIIEYMARHVKNNVRELEGALNKLIAYTRMRQEIPSLKEASRLLATLIYEPKKKTTTGQKILECVANFYDVSIKDLISRGRRQEIVKPRQVVMFLMRSECNLSYPGIGQQLGGRDHTTAIHSFKQVESNLRNDQNLRNELETIKEKIYN